MKNLVTITIPVYKDRPNASEIASYNQCLKVLGKYPITLFVPSGMSTTNYDTSAPNVNVLEVPHRYLNTREAYSAFMLDQSFYKQFIDSEYILIYQLDAWVFRDELEYWCKQGYHYIGAPWSFKGTNNVVNIGGVGNGGFSLRHVSKSIEVLDEAKKCRESGEYRSNILNPVASSHNKTMAISLINNDPTHISSQGSFTEVMRTGKYLHAEDGYWAGAAGIFVKDFIIPSGEIASKFSMEGEAPTLYARNNNILPFGCHGWGVRSPDFWSKFIVYDKSYQCITNTSGVNPEADKINTLFYRAGDSTAETKAKVVNARYPQIKIKSVDMGDKIQIITKQNSVIQGSEAIAIINKLLSPVIVDKLGNETRIQFKSNYDGRTLNILVAALYVRGIPSEGGSSFYMRCIIDTLREMGHTVNATTSPSTMSKLDYDLIICSHHKILSQLSKFNAPKICIAQGIIEPEELHAGADKYYSISEETRLHNIKRGIYSDVIGQPVTVPDIQPVNEKLTNILVVRNNATLTSDNPFKCLERHYNVRYGDPAIPIEEQMKWADLCITLGRGAVSSMSLGRPVLVADNRGYIGKVGDGYTSQSTIYEIAKHNFSGRRFKNPITEEWLLSELKKYNPSDSRIVYEYVKSNHNMQTAVNRMLSDTKYLVANSHSDKSYGSTQKSGTHLSTNQHVIIT